VSNLRLKRALSDNNAAVTMTISSRPSGLIMKQLARNNDRTLPASTRACTVSPYRVRYCGVFGLGSHVGDGGRASSPLQISRALNPKASNPRQLSTTTKVSPTDLPTRFVSHRPLVVRSHGQTGIPSRGA
jgi:hypothetical protein